MKNSLDELHIRLEIPEKRFSGLENRSIKVYDMNNRRKKRWNNK